MTMLLEGLAPEPYDREYKDAKLVGRVLAYFRPHTRPIAAIVAIVLAAAILDTGVPVLISQGIDGLTTASGVELLAGLSLSVLALVGLSWLCNYGRQRLTAQVIAEVVLVLRQDAVQAVTHQDLSFYDRYPAGKIISRVTSDTQDFSVVITLLVEMLSQLVLVILITGWMFWLDGGLAGWSLVPLPLAILAALIFRRVARRNSRRSIRLTANVSGIIQESISGIGVAKSFSQESTIYQDFLAANLKSYKATLISGLTISTIYPVLNSLSGLGIASVIYFGGLSVTQGSVTLGDWYLFVQALAIFYLPLVNLASFWPQFQQGLSASERVFALIDSEPEVRQIAEKPVKPLLGEIEFDRVSFSYDGKSPVLADFSLQVSAGQTLAIVGHTGAGKTSLARLLARFYEFQGGRILVDGEDIRTFELASYRHQVGIVPQEPFLFSGTIADNIRYGRPTASDTEVAEVARQIGGDNWGVLENGLQTQVGERGKNLSMGQRQLVALARLLLQNPSILILDEATASIDPFTEAQIQQALALVMAGRTSLVIAHRLSTVENADRLIVMKQGQIVEEGPHYSLLAQGGYYAEMYNTYFKHQALDYQA